MDQRKDESIERTFKGVAKHFREVFSELVQGGHGFLVMMKKKVCYLIAKYNYVFIYNVSLSLSLAFNMLAYPLFNTIIMSYSVKKMKELQEKEDTVSAKRKYMRATLIKDFNYLLLAAGCPPISRNSKKSGIPQNRGETNSLSHHQRIQFLLFCFSDTVGFC